MKLALLQFSDIHLRKTGNHIFEKLDKLFASFQNELLGIEKIFIIISGDMAFSGQEEEYNLAIELLDKLRDNLQDYHKDINKDTDIEFLLIPGNHDCDFITDDNTVRTLLVQNIQNDNNIINPQLIDECSKIQENFFDFVSLYENKEKMIFNDKLIKIYNFELGDKKIVFHCFNTSWISELHEQPGKMVYPINNYQKKLTDNKGDYVVTLMHHPYNWFNPINGRAIKNIVEDNSDLILTGHEHVSSHHRKVDPNGNHSEYIEGGVLQESKDLTLSEFNLILLNVEDEKQQLNKFKWNQDKNLYEITHMTEWRKYKRLQKLNKNTFVLNDKFNNYLTDPGVKLNHPRKKDLYLEDLYIYPDAKIVNVNKNSEEIIEYIKLNKLTEIKEINKYIILGEEKSGKTALCKMLFKHYYNSGYVPILINGPSINKHTIEEINKMLFKNYKEQYNEDSSGAYRQLDNKKKVIFIDNFDKTKLNNKYKGELIKNMSQYYNNIILTGNEIFQLFDLFDTSIDEKLSGVFEKLEITEFGHRLRNELIHAWNSMGRKETITDTDLIKENDKTTGIVNTIIGKNYVPSFPFFLLIILQSVESGVTHNLKESSYGYYYDFLITQSFIDINMKPEELDAFYNYITELAYRFYNDDITEISKDELLDFHDRFKDEYDIYYDFDKNLKRLLDSAILEDITNTYRFKYKYAYYYFVAKYFSKNLTELKTREQISIMCGKLHIEENANIIMFLTHMSKDPYIFNEVLNQAQNIFKGYEPTKLQNEISELNNLIGNIPEIVYEHIEVKQHREEQLLIKDEIERSQKETASSAIEDSYDNEEKNGLDLVATLNSAFKTIEIIGQILKNYYGSIKGDEKYILCSEAYNIGLRSLGSFLTMMDQHISGIIQEIQRIIEEKNIVDKKDIDNISRKFVFNICCMISYNVIKKVSNSVGSDNLVGTFKKLLNDNDTVSVKLIDISIKLDHLRTIPFNEIKDLNNTLKSNLLPYNILRGLVVNHLYMFHTSYKDKQRICDLLDISVGKQRSIELLSHRKKDK